MGENNVFLEPVCEDYIIPKGYTVPHTEPSKYLTGVHNAMANSENHVFPFSRLCQAEPNFQSSSPNINVNITCPLPLPPAGRPLLTYPPNP